MIDALVDGIGRTPRSRMNERLFRLDELVPPTGVAGRAAPAATADAQLLSTWLLDFGEEAFGYRESDEFGRDQIQRGLTFGTCWLWTVEDSPVSFAYRHAAVDGVARIGPVYTPPEFRRHGYGSAVTAAAARQILDGGDVRVPVHRPGQPDVQQDLSGDRFPPGARPVRGQVRTLSSQSRNAANEYGRPRKSATRSAASLLPPGASTRSR